MLPPIKGPEELGHELPLPTACRDPGRFRDLRVLGALGVLGVFRGFRVF